MSLNSTSQRRLDCYYAEKEKHKSLEEKKWNSPRKYIIKCKVPNERKPGASEEKILCGKEIDGM